MEQPDTSPTAKPRRNIGQRIARLYRITALVVFNTLVLFGMALLILNAILPKTPDSPQKLDDTPVEMRPIGVNQVYSTRFNRNAYYLMQPDDVNTLLVEMDTWAAQGQWQVHPWTGLTSRPFNGKFLNINASGDRFVPPPDPAYADKSPFVVWFFGGSTAFGWGLSDDVAPPAQMQVALQNLMPDRQVKVINFAVPIFNSSAELALFVANLRYDKPDAAVFLDGINDVWYTFYGGNPTPLANPLAGAWEASIARATAPLDAPWITLNPSFPPYRLARQLNINMPQISPDYEINYAMQVIPAITTPDEQMKFTVEQYQANQRMATAIGDEFGVATYFFLQPWNNGYYPEFQQALNTNNANPRFFDVTDAFSQVDTTRYSLLIDDLHYSDYASNILAEQMARLMTEQP